MKLAEITIISMLGLMKDEHIFSILAFMKINCAINWGHLDMTIHMFAQKFFTQENFPYHETNIRWEKQKLEIGATT
jgi:hypothetical protein